MMQKVQAVAMLERKSLAADSALPESELSGSRRVLWHARAWRPPTDICETEDAFVARIEISGMRNGQITVSLADRVLVVSGVRPGVAPQGAYHQMEIQFGEFRTEVRLPSPVIENEVEASYGDGFLTVVMPKRKALRVPVR
jgi:HSP20 family molecular chaperone IbpA